jgi:HlyD family secretion protein
MTAPSSTNAPALQSSAGDVTASGVVVPAQTVNIGLALPSRIRSIEVSEGQAVKEGELLIELTGLEQLLAAVSAAEFELLSAQQAADIALAQAQLEYANAMDALDDAEREWTVNQPGNRATSSGIKDAEADVEIAERRLTQARNQYNNASGTTAKAQAQIALTAAEKAYYQAIWLLRWYQSEPTELEQALLDGELAFAQARVKSAETELALLEDTDPDAMALVEVRLKLAEQQLAAAQSALNDGEIRAPFSGTIIDIFVNPGEAVVPGQVLITLADLENYQVETTDLSERDVVQVKVGQPVVVFLEALGVQVEGVVGSVSLQSNTLGGDVVYPVIIDIPDHPEDLRWGMSVEVEIITD